ncbi:hypothetical protein BGX34_007595, partial [Mortierella sp. NVP85]
KSLELNPKNSIIKTLKAKVDADKNDKTVKDLTLLMYDVALIVSGFSIEKTDIFADRINRMIKLGLAIDDDDEEASTSDMPALEAEDVVEASEMEEVD